MKSGLFSRRSSSRLETCDPRLQDLFNEVIEIHDCTVIEGARSKGAQDRAVARGRSQLAWPRSKHNVVTPEEAAEHGVPERPLALAVDVAPWIRGVGIPWADNLARLFDLSKREAEVVSWAHFAFFAGVVGTVAHRSGFRVRWGGDWDGDGVLLLDQRLDDGPHFELVV